MLLPKHVTLVFAGFVVMTAKPVSKVFSGVRLALKVVVVTGVAMLGRR